MLKNVTFQIVRFMRIIHITPEIAPWVKAGGLSDVVSCLAKQTQKAGHFVEVVIPAYSFILSHFENQIYQSLPLEWEAFSKKHQATVHFVKTEDCELRLIEIYGHSTPFRRAKIYGEPDDLFRFISFSRAAVAFLATQQTPLDIIHLHDWTTALVAPLIKRWYPGHSVLQKSKLIFTLHNTEMQGICSPSDLEHEGIDGYAFASFDALADPHKPSKLNLLKGAISFCDAIVPVSKTYAKEILSPEGGAGLDKVFNYHKAKIYGILNGIDFDFWDPGKDPLLPAHYTAENSKEEIILAKRLCRQEFCKKLGLTYGTGPLIIAISRLTRQKSPELLLETLWTSLRLGFSCALLGSGDEPYFTSLFQSAQRDLPKERSGAIFIGFDEKLAHLAYAAADAIIIPSLYEPCGLTQMIGMRYGTLPIARKTGGLADTIEDGVNGYLFEYPDAKSIHWALERFSKQSANHPEKLWEMQKNGLHTDNSCKRQIADYLELYQKLHSL